MKAVHRSLLACGETRQGAPPNSRIVKRLPRPPTIDPRREQLGEGSLRVKPGGYQLIFKQVGGEFAP